LKFKFLNIMDLLKIVYYHFAREGSSIFSLSHPTPATRGSLDEDRNSHHRAFNRFGWSRCRIRVPLDRASIRQPSVRNRRHADPVVRAGASDVSEGPVANPKLIGKKI
jgi:hypothetical protein